MVIVAMTNGWRGGDVRGEIAGCSSGQCFFEMVKGLGEVGKVQDAIKKASAAD